MYPECRDAVDKIKLYLLCMLLQLVFEADERGEGGEKGNFANKKPNAFLPGSRDLVSKFALKYDLSPLHQNLGPEVFSRKVIYRAKYNLAKANTISFPAIIDI